MSPRPGFDPEFHDLRRYDQLVRQLDDLVGDLVGEIDGLGLAQETIVVLTSDHGEAFFEHGDHGHGWTVYGEVLRVPLLVWAPGLVRPRVIEDVVGLVDVTPTVLDLVGRPAIPGVDGRSLAPALREAAPLSPRRYYAEAAPGTVRALRDDRFKLFRWKRPEEDVLYDLVRDAREGSPVRLAEGLPSTLADAADEIRSLREDLDRRAAACRAQRQAAEARRSAGSPSALDPARREKLRALGYLD